MSAAPRSALENPLVQKVRKALRAALPDLPRRVLLGCSGGPDSTALLLALSTLRDVESLTCTVVCIDHQLRAEAAQEASWVCQVAQRLGFAAEAVPVAVEAQGSRMAAARAARYQALTQRVQLHRAQALLVAHILEDQSETMLMRWLSGAGLTGLVGMRAVRPLPPVSGSVEGQGLLVRPMLSVSKAEVLAFLAEHGDLVAPLPVQDPTNHSLHYQRSRLRHQLLPLLRQEQPRLDRHLLELSELLRADAEYLDQQAQHQLDLLQRAVVQPGIPSSLEPGPLRPLSASGLASLPMPIFVRVLQRACGVSLGQRHLLALRQLCLQPWGSRELNLPQGWQAQRCYDQLTIFSRRQALVATAREADLPGVPEPEVQLPDCGSYQLAEYRVEVQPIAPASAPPSLAANSSARLPFSTLTVHRSRLPLTLRYPRPGDRIALRGLGGHHRKVSDVLVDRKVPKAQRAQVLLLCAGPNVLLLVGLCAAELSTESSAQPAMASAITDGGPALNDFVQVTILPRGRAGERLTTDARVQ
ncbi:MAG TPA: tRNA lysidine(34) synthetase TilS [Pseudomonadota bacterium]|nr:tRNA lysidine(34) synthetase TilS [Pseudomonadota bacterium]